MKQVHHRLLAPLLEDRRVFLLLGFASFAGAFSLRLARDTALFSSAFLPAGFELGPIRLQTGADVLPLSFLANAILMTFFATRLGDWLQRISPERISIAAFSATVVAGSISTLVLPNAHSPWVFLTFYIIAEVPIFLFMNMVWILAGPRFTELEQREFFPKVTGAAYVGALAPSAIMLVFTSTGRVGIGLLLVLASVAAMLILICASELARRLGAAEAEAGGEPQTVEPLRPSIVEDLRWALGRPYMAFFVFVTVANFVLLGIFDQTMASAAAARGMDAATLLHYLLIATSLFALASALVQLFLFRRMLDYFGTAKVNLFAPVFMMLGCMSYVLFGTTWLTGTEPSSEHLFFAALGARVCGWFAEFLFNQALLPYIYGALPVRDENRGRLLVEGPVTAITNGAVGLLLAAYVFYFAVGNEGRVRFDLLFVTAIVLAVLMLVGSILMVPQYRIVLLERLRAGDPIDRIDIASRRFLAPLFSARQFGQSGRIAAGAGDARLARTLAEADQDAFIAALPSREDIPTAQQIAIIVRTAERLGLLAQIEDRLVAWLRSAKGLAFMASAEALCALGFDGAAAVRDEVERRRRMESGSEISRADRLALAAMLRSESLISESLEGLWDHPIAIDEMDVVLLARQTIARPALVLDIFLFVLARLAAEAGPILPAALQMLERHPWLRFVVLETLKRPRAKTPIQLRGGRHVVPLLLGVSFAPGSDNRDLDLLKAASAAWRDSHSKGGCIDDITELLASSASNHSKSASIDEELLALLLHYAQAGDEPGVLAALAKVTSDRGLVSRSSPDLSAIIAAWRATAANQVGSAVPKSWRRARAIQLILARLHLAVFEARDELATLSAPLSTLAVRLVDGGSQRDRTLTILEQTAPRAIYRSLHADLELVWTVFARPSSQQGRDAVLTDSTEPQELAKP